ncbi:MAG: hypothetical protein OXH22_09240 [Chloroflexi bacterium]|nr:hypothetical protein [Chloroflexota bacterium]
MELIVTILIVIVIALVIRKFTTPSDYTDAKGRNRCGRCKKIVYGDGESAHSAAENALSRGMYLRAYYNNRCGYWHLTSQQPRY